MPRLPHGTAITESALRKAREDARANLRCRGATQQPAPIRLPVSSLQHDPDALLPVTDQTVGHLRAVADTMTDDNTGDDSAIPAAYTYFGQFIDHDVTLEVNVDPNVDTAEILADDMKPLSVDEAQSLIDCGEDVKPLSVDEAQSLITNQRSATLDLDSVYGSNPPTDPNDPAKLKVGTVTKLNNPNPPTKRPDGKADENDVPRQGRNANRTNDRAALIGDPPQRREQHHLAAAGRLPQGAQPPGGRGLHV
jgi:hypothetical protein